MQWFRMWAEAVDDAKIRLLSFDDRWHFVALLCLKAQGILEQRNKELRQQMICAKFGMTSAELETVMKRLVTVGLVSNDGQPKNWGKRQFTSDSSTNRVRKHRETLRKRFGNGPDTEQIQNRTEEEGAVAPVVQGLDPVVWTRWLDYRSKIRKPLKPVSIPAAQRELAAFGNEQAAVVEKSIAEGWTGLFPLKGKPKGAETARLEQAYPGHQF